MASSQVAIVILQIFRQCPGGAGVGGNNYRHSIEVIESTTVLLTQGVFAEVESLQGEINETAQLVPPAIHRTISLMVFICNVLYIIVPHAAEGKPFQMDHQNLRQPPQVELLGGSHEFFTTRTEPEKK